MNKRRIIDALQNITLLLLTVSAVFLVTRIPQFQEGVGGGGYGYGEEDTYGTCNSATEGDCRKNDQRGEMDLRAHHLGIDEVVLEDLKDDEVNDEPKRLHRIECKDHKGTDAAADKSADYGNKLGDAHHGAYHSRIGEAEDQHTDEAENTEDHSLQRLTCDEATEIHVQNFCGVNKPACLLLGEPGVYHAG